MLAAAVLMSSGCSGGPTDSDAPEASGGADGSGGGEPSGGSHAGGTGSGGASPSGGATSTGGTPGSGGEEATGGTTGTGGANATAATELFPLGLGYVWTTNQPSTDSECNPAYPSQEVYAITLVGDREAWVMSYPCYAQDPTEDALLAVIDGQIAQYLEGSWQITLALPVEEGHTWTIQNDGTPMVFTWHAEGEVTVPAGTFTDCWRREEANEVGYGVTYCPGVGPVRWAYVANTSELTAYDFD